MLLNVYTVRGLFPLYTDKLNSEVPANDPLLRGSKLPVPKPVALAVFAALWFRHQLSRSSEGAFFLQASDSTGIAKDLLVDQSLAFKETSVFHTLFSCR